MVAVKRQWPHLSGTLLLSSFVSIGLLFGAIALDFGLEYTYMVWNLFLAWLPLLFMWLLLRVLRRHHWLSWQAIVPSLLWLGFLPNSFYLITDYIHLKEVTDADVVYMAVMMTSFVLNGLILGFLSLYLFHVQLRKRLPSLQTRLSIAGVLLASSFAIYLGRYLRWNTWDVLRDPAGILLDVTNRIASPFSYPRMLITTTIFFVLLSSLYLVVYNVVRTLKQPAQS